MSEDELLKSLGAIARDEREEARRSRWEAFLRDEVSPEQIAELEREAAEDPHAALLLESHRPLGTTTRAQIVDELAEGILATRGEDAGGRIIKAAPWWRARTTVAMASVSLAAGIAFLVTTQPRTLPTYVFEVSDESVTRSPSSPTGGVPSCGLRAREVGEFELLARADGRVEGDVMARAFLMKAGEPRPWAGHVEVSSQGSVHILEPSRTLAGASELRIVLGRSELMTPDAALSKARGVENAGRGWQVLRCRIDSSEAP